MADKLKILAISGSLRKASYNTGLLRAAQELAPEDMTIDIYDIGDIPLYNQDAEKDGFPPEVEKFRAAIREADALLFATPEYNFSITGVLKNAIDWASRGQRGAPQPFHDKPMAIMGAGSGLGTGRAQYHLRQIAVFLNMHPINKPEVMVAQAWEKFDQQSNLAHEETRQKVGELLVALRDWTHRLKK